jgi:hypothetical protein
MAHPSLWGPCRSGRHALPVGGWPILRRGARVDPGGVRAWFAFFHPLFCFYSFSIFSLSLSFLFLLSHFQLQFTAPDFFEALRDASTVARSASSPLAFFWTRSRPAVIQSSRCFPSSFLPADHRLAALHTLTMPPTAEQMRLRCAPHLIPSKSCP